METPAEKPAETQPPQPQQPDQPTSVPTPEDPRENAPMRDPPSRPDHDRTRIAGGPGERPGNPSPDSIVFDENKSGR